MSGWSRRDGVDRSGRPIVEWHAVGTGGREAWVLAAGPDDSALCLRAEVLTADGWIVTIGDAPAPQSAATRRAECASHIGL